MSDWIGKLTVSGYRNPAATWFSAAWDADVGHWTLDVEHSASS